MIIVWASDSSFTPSAMLFCLAITDIKWALFIEHKYLSHWLNTSKSHPPTRRWKHCLVWPRRLPPPPHSYWFQSYNLCPSAISPSLQKWLSGFRPRNDNVDFLRRSSEFSWVVWLWVIHGHMHTDTIPAMGQCHVLRVSQGQTGSLFILNACFFLKQKPNAPYLTCTWASSRLAGKNCYCVLQTVWDGSFIKLMLNTSMF